MHKLFKHILRPGKSSLVVALVTFLTVSPAHAAVNIVIQNADAAGVGFNDTGAYSPQGGNFANTIGQARLNAFRYAAAVIGAQLTSAQTVTIQASMPELFCDASSALLGQAGTTTVHRDFAGAPLAATWYPAALSNTLNASDLNGAGMAEISTEFNSKLDSGDCLGGQTWYYGFDGNPGSDTDFVSVLMHELLHGFGVASFANAADGTLFNAMDDAYTVNLQDLSLGLFLTDALATDAQRMTAFIDDGDLHWAGAAVASLATGQATAEKENAAAEAKLKIIIVGGQNCLTISIFSLMNIIIFLKNYSLKCLYII